VGLQIVGCHPDEAIVLRAGRAFEEATGYGTSRPPVQRTEMFLRSFET
jgi:amidase